MVLDALITSSISQNNNNIFDIEYKLRVWLCAEKQFPLAVYRVTIFYKKAAVVNHVLTFMLYLKLFNQAKVFNNSSMLTRKEDFSGVGIFQKKNLLLHAFCMLGIVWITASR